MLLVVFFIVQTAIHLLPTYSDFGKELFVTGTRFVHTSEGRFLVTRLVPCPRCVAASQADTDSVQHQHRGPDSWNESSISSGALGQKLVAEVRDSQ